MSGETYNYANCLGFSKWDYNTLNKAGSAQMTVNSITTNNISPLNLFFNHDFISKKMTPEDNIKFINDLTTILNSVNAKNITSNIFISNTGVVQNILVNYNIDNVEQSKVDSLTTTIASVCKTAIEDISLKYSCSNV
jgi:hypothetical protein